MEDGVVELPFRPKRQAEVDMCLFVFGIDGDGLFPVLAGLELITISVVRVGEVEERLRITRLNLDALLETFDRLFQLSCEKAQRGLKKDILGPPIWCDSTSTRHLTFCLQL